MQLNAHAVDLATVKLAPGRGPRRTGTYDAIVEAVKRLPAGKALQLKNEFPKHFRFALRKHSLDAGYPLVVRVAENGDYVLHADTGTTPQSPKAKRPPKK